VVGGKEVKERCSEGEGTQREKNGGRKTEGGLTGRRRADDTGRLDQLHSLQALSNRLEGNDPAARLPPEDDAELDIELPEAERERNAAERQRVRDEEAHQKMTGLITCLELHAHMCIESLGGVWSGRGRRESTRSLADESIANMAHSDAEIALRKSVTVFHCVQVGRDRGAVSVCVCV
jgi:hypothetical protein